MDMMPFSRRAIVEWIEGRCAKHGVSSSAFGYFALGDPGFMRRLRDPGSNVGLLTLERACAKAANDVEMAQQAPKQKPGRPRKNDKVDDLM